MRFKRPIYRYLFYTAWLAAVGGVIFLLVSANSKSKTRTVKGVEVSVNNGGDRIYVEKADVLKNIEATAGGRLVSRNSGNLNLALLESGLEKNPWIQDAELYFDTKDVLHVAITERVPFARVFTTAGSSFYIDSTGHKLPLLENYSVKLPVVTGFTPAKKLNKADSTLLQETKEVVRTISEDAFWNAQVGQIDITPERKFELIPLVGNHVIRLGSGYNTAEKLEKLMVFYRQVLPKAGLAKYSALDVQFNNQVVAVRRGPTNKVDSIQLQKNIKELLEKKMAEQEPTDLVQTVQPAPALSNGDFEPGPANGGAAIAPLPETQKAVVPETLAAAKEVQTAKKPADIQSTPKKTETNKSKPERKPVVAKKAPAQKPKAVMPATASNEY
ncbi:FtsQ-type POTRA domain-containing protein [Flavisolibacter sp. BT320]|nr:FtsQ-type POTRA domain-containing protein [Flavisolibacter longurius]